MKMTLHWKRKIFSTTSEIYSGESVIGRLKENSWTQSAKGDIHGRRYQYKTKGVFKPVTAILDSNSNAQVGRIEYNSWMTKAHIQISEHSYHWKYDNRWNTRWSLSDSEGVCMKCHGSSSKGTIEFDHDDDLLLLTGLFVTNYYSQMAIVIMVAILVPIFASVST